MMRIGKILRSLPVALVGVFAAHAAWAVNVGETLTFSSVEKAASAETKAGGAYGALALKIPFSDELPPKSVVTLKTIKLGLRAGDYSSSDPYLVVGGIGAQYANTQRTVSETSDFGGVKAITFDGYNRDLKVGEAYTCQFRAGAGGNVNGRTQQLQVFSTASNVGDEIRINNGSTWSLVYEITVEVKSLGEAIDVDAIEAAQPIKDNFLNVLMWLDAKDAATITKNANDKVTEWGDKSVYERNATPMGESIAEFKTNFGDYTATAENDLGAIVTTNGVLAFNMGGVASGVDMAYERMTSVRTVFWVMDIAQSYHAFFLGDSSAYDFHRNSNAAYGHGSWGVFGNANTKIWCDGALVQDKTGVAVPTGLHVFATVLPSNANSDRLSTDRNTTDGDGTHNYSRHGGRALSELIVLDTALTDAEVESVSAYLYEKWFAPVELSGSGEYRISTMSAAAGANANVVLTLAAGSKLIFDETTDKHVALKSSGLVEVVVNANAAASLDAFDFGQAQVHFIVDSASPASALTRAWTILAAQRLTVDGTAATEANPLEITGRLDVAGVLVTKGQVKLSYNGTAGNGTGNVVSGTMEVVNGTTAIKFNDRGMQGTLTIDEGATLKPYGYVDAVKYDGTTTVNVYGTLDMSDTWARWTVRAANTMNFYVGATVIGNGQSGNNTGAIQPNTATTFHFLKKADGEAGEIQFKALYHSQVASTFDIEDGVTVVMENEAGLGTGKEPITVDGEGTLVIKSAMPFNNAITVNESAKVVIESTGSLAKGATGAGEVAFKAVEIALGTGYRAPLTLTIPAETTSLSFQVTDAETAAGFVTFKFANETLPEGLSWSATTSGGTAVNVTVGEKAADGTVMVTLGVTKFEASTSTSEWPYDTTGRVIIQGVTEEGSDEVTLTFDHELPDGVVEIYFIGKVIVAAEGMTLPSGKFKFAPGSDVTVSADLRAGTTTVTSGATLRVQDVEISKSIEVQGGAKLVTSGAVTFLSTMQVTAPGQKDSVVEIAPGSTLTLTANNQLPTNVKVNVYGTLDIGETTLSYNNNPGQCEYNFYAGSVMTGTTGVFKMTGGYTAVYNVRAYAEATVPYATIDVLRARDVYNCATDVNVENGVGLKWLKTSSGNPADITVKGADVRGLEIQGATNVKFGDYEKGLKGDLVIGAGAKLTLTRTDSLEYNSANGAAIINLDIAGTLDCGEFRQTLSNSNSAHEAGKMVLRDGGQIVGDGVANWKSSNTNCALDVWKPATIEVKGVTTISAPIYLEDQSSTLTIQPLEENGTGTLVLTAVNGNANTTIDLQPGAQVQLPDTVDATKVVTTARGMMIASKPAETEGQTVYRTVPKSFTISIR